MFKGKQPRNLPARVRLNNSLPQGIGLLTNIIRDGKAALDQSVAHVGRLFLEYLLESEREGILGEPYHPKEDTTSRRWARQKGSVYIGGGKIPVMVPRIRGENGEIPLQTYRRLHSSRDFSEQMLALALRGLSANRYEETLVALDGQFGVSRSSCSRRLVEATTRELKEFREQRLEGFEIFALLLDGIHMAGSVFVAAVGVDRAGKKKALGFWEGSTENSEVCLALLSDLENRGLSLHPAVLCITDGGKGIIKALQARFGKKWLHQRCVLHKRRNLIDHLPRRFHVEAGRRFDNALGLVDYAEARKDLLQCLAWLREVSISAADSLEEGFEQLLTLHRLNVPVALRKSLRSTNLIDSAFSKVRWSQKNIQRLRPGRMAHRWLAATLMDCEARFRKVCGYEHIPAVIETLQSHHRKLEITKKLG